MIFMRLFRRFRLYCWCCLQWRLFKQIFFFIQACASTILRFRISFNHIDIRITEDLLSTLVVDY